MPTYRYRCKSCLKEFEELQKMSDPPIIVCPSCTKHTLVRVIDGGAGFVFKGTGFYLTDYKNKHYSGESKAPKKSPPSTEQNSPKSPGESSPKK